MKRRTRVTNEQVTEMLRMLHDDADRISSEMPEVDAESILTRAESDAREPSAGRRPIGGSWIVRSAAAAAVLAAAVGILLIAIPGPLPSGPVPEHLTTLVDSLYPDPASDYVHDEIGAMLWQPGEDDGAYLDDVWDSVITDIQSR